MSLTVHNSNNIMCDSVSTTIGECCRPNTIVVQEKPLGYIIGENLAYLAEKISSKVSQILGRHDNEEIVQNWVKNNGMYLQYASPRLQNNEKVVKIAVEQNPRSLKFAGRSVTQNKDILLSAVRKDGRLLKHAPRELRNDKEVVKEAMKQNAAKAFKYASFNLQRDRELVLLAIQSDPWRLKYVQEEFRQDKEIILTAVRCAGAVLRYASEELQDDAQVVETAIKNEPYALYSASKRLRCDPGMQQLAGFDTGLQRHKQLAKSCLSINLY